MQFEEYHPEQAADAPVREAAMEALLQALDRGQEPAWPESQSQAGVKSGLARAYERYRGLLREVRHSRGECLLLPGQRLADFEVVELLGRGGMGEVYRARQLSLGGRMVALKVLLPERKSTLDRERFGREARLLSALHHSHLAEVYGYGSADNLCYLVMRLVEGGTLAQRLGPAAPALRLSVIARWAEEVAEALSVVHGAGLVHRDVKPANIVLEPREQGAAAVLVDFGLARPVLGPTQTTLLPAPLTRAYAAPEQLVGSPVDARTDVYSLGVVLRELLARVAVAEAGCNRGRALAAIAMRASAPEPNLRYPTAREFAHDLAAWRAGQRRRAQSLGWLRLKSMAFGAGRMAGTSALFRAALVITAICVLALLLDAKARLREAQAAREDLDLPRLRASSQQISLAFGAVVWPDPELTKLVQRLQRRSEGDPLTVVTDLLERGETVRAIMQAGQCLAQRGLCSEPTLLELLTRACARPELRTQALTTLMLAAEHHPVITLEALKGTAGLRAVLRTLAEDPELTSAERYCQIALWSALGDSEDSERLAQRWLRIDPGGEESRLCLEALERSLRRSWSLGEDALLLARLPWAEMLARTRDLRASGLAGNWGNVMAQTRLISQLHLTRRRLQLRSDANLALPAAWLEADQDGIGQGCFEPTLELAAAGDARAFTVLHALQPARRSQWQADLLGRIAAWVGDRNYLPQAKARLVDIGWNEAAALRQLESAWLCGLRERESAWSAAEEPLSAVDNLAALVSSEDGRIHTLPALHSPELSHLDLTLGAGAVLGGKLEAAYCSDARYCREGNDLPYLLLDLPGQSCLQVDFRWEPPEPPPARIHVKGQTSARRNLPYQGSAILSLWLDGSECTLRATSEIYASWIEFPIEADRIEPGLRRFTLLLAPGSTTSYRVESLSLGE